MRHDRNPTCSKALLRWRPVRPSGRTDPRLTHLTRFRMSGKCSVHWADYYASPTPWTRAGRRGSDRRRRADRRRPARELHRAPVRLKVVDEAASRRHARVDGEYLRRLWRAGAGDTVLA